MYVFHKLPFVTSAEYTVTEEEKGREKFFTFAQFDKTLRLTNCAMGERPVSCVALSLLWCKYDSVVWCAVC